MKRLLPSASGLMMLMLSAGAMAGTFDGKWIGYVSSSGRCDVPATMTITVTGHTLSGAVHNPRNVAPFEGSIDADGNGTFTTHRGYPGSIEFTANRFDANWNSGGCQRHALGDRAPTSIQTAAWITERKQAQATYDELTARAAAGDRSVDFTALRASYPFTRQWDVDSRTSGPLLEQAQAAAGGGDCATALDKLDQVLKIDYTMTVAHRLRSHCLKGHAARIEAKIADGLMASLKHGGNGKSERTAYPVMTLHEETDLLAYRHIVLKARDVEVRGSNGRFYDVVHGISLQDGIGIQVGIEDVYFDVTAEVNARESAMAAADAVKSDAP